MGRRATVLSLVVAAVAVSAPAAHAAPEGTLAGRLTGAKLPARGAGVVPLHAVRLTDGRIAGGGYARAGGAFSLRTQPGPYALIATVVPFRGRAGALTRVAAFGVARAGKRSKVKATLKKRKPRRRAHRSAARAAFVEVSVPAVAVLEFQAPAGDLAVLRRGLPNMLVTDIAAGIEASGCNAILVERMDLDKVIAEQKLQADARFDSGTRVRKGRLIANNQTITGSLTLSGGTLTISATHTNLRTGRSATVSQTGPADSIFDLEQALAPKLVQLICPHTPKTYNTTFNGTWRTDLSTYTVQWSGSARVELLTEDGAPPDRWPSGRYAQYKITSGTVHAVLSGTRNGASPGSCTVHGEADFALTALPTASLAVQLDQDAPAFWVAFSSRGDEMIPYTETGAGCNQQDPSYPLTGLLFASTPDPLTTTDPAGPLSANTSWDLGSGYNHYSSQFTFTPAG